MISERTRYAFPGWERVSKGMDDPFMILLIIQINTQCFLKQAEYSSKKAKLNLK